MTEYPSQEEIRAADPLQQWVDRRFLRRDPYAFRGLDFSSLILDAVELFDVDANSVFCVGSGAIGLSLNPNKVTGGNLKAFDLESDLDVALVSHVHFETAWRDLRSAAHPLAEISETLQKHLSWQKKRLFDGVILTHALLTELSFGGEWLTAKARFDESIAIMLDRDVEVNMWVFRDYWSLRAYVSDSVVKCRRVLA